MRARSVRSMRSMTTDTRRATVPRRSRARCGMAAEVLACAAMPLPSFTPEGVRPGLDLARAKRGIPAERVSREARLKVAIVGCGKIADGHIEEIQKIPSITH